MYALLNKVQAAKLLNISVRTLDRRVASGHLPSVSDHPGARVHFKAQDLESYVNSIHRSTKEDD